MRNHLYLATVFKAKGMMDDFEEELTEVDRLLTEIRVAPLWLYSVGKIYARMGRTKEATQLLDDISARLDDPIAKSAVNRSNRGDQAAYYGLKGEIELARGNYDEAVELFRIADKLGSSLESLAYGYFSHWGLG